MAREIQRIGLGFVKASPQTRNPKQWLGRWLEHYGLRLQRTNPSGVALATRKPVAIHSRTSVQEWNTSSAQ